MSSRVRRFIARPSRHCESIASLQAEGEAIPCLLQFTGPKIGAVAMAENAARQTNSACLPASARFCFFNAVSGNPPGSRPGARLSVRFTAKTQRPEGLRSGTALSSCLCVFVVNLAFRRRQKPGPAQHRPAYSSCDLLVQNGDPVASRCVACALRDGPTALCTAHRRRSCIPASFPANLHNVIMIGCKE